MARDATTDPSLRSWVASAADSAYPIQNLPYGAFDLGDGTRGRLGVAIGDAILDLAAVSRAGLLDQACVGARDVFAGATLDAFLACGPRAWRAVRERLSALLAVGNARLEDVRIANAALVPQRDARMRLAFSVADYVDFYASIEHATNAGRIFRPAGEPLFANYRHLPVGYHGRSGTVVRSGAPIVRPRGQIATPAGPPTFAPTRELDYEVELGFVTGNARAHRTPDDARDAIFGVSILCDWSARDIQSWEAQPLGPFLGKSFATTLGPWIVSLDALEPYRVAHRAQRPPPLPHLAHREPGAYDVAVTATLASAAMRANGAPRAVLSRATSRSLYWTMGQMLAHVTSNGTPLRAGDLFGTGTISNADPASYGSLLELTMRGTRPLALGDGTSRGFLEDGDGVTIDAVASAPGLATVGFGSLLGTISPSS